MKALGLQANLNKSIPQGVAVKIVLQLVLGSVFIHVHVQQFTKCLLEKCHAEDTLGSQSEPQVIERDARTET